MRLTHLTTLLFSFIPICSTNRKNLPRSLLRKDGIKNNNFPINMALSAAKRKTSNHSTLNWKKPNEVGKYKVTGTTRTNQRQFMSTKRLKFEKNSISKIHTKFKKTKTIKHKDRVLSKKQFIPNTFSGFPGGAWMQGSSLSRAAFSRQGPCANSPCHNNAMCFAQGSGFYCSCLPGFIGSKCEAKRICQPDTCKNGGTCSEETMNQHICTCAAGFRGVNCDELSRCHPNPCHNGATCTETEDGFDCQCVMGYKGKNCQEVDSCLPNPCKSGGTCMETGSEFYCNCPIGHKGRTCEIISECTRSPCKNGATCMDDVGGFKCLCRQGYSGASCQASACHPSPCKNDGVCMKFANQISCHCPRGYTGKTCEVRSPCSQDICLNGGRCLENGLTNNNSGFACVCPQGYSGVICEKKLTLIN